MYVNFRDMMLTVIFLLMLHGVVSEYGKEALLEGFVYDNCLAEEVDLESEILCGFIFVDHPHLFLED